MTGRMPHSALRLKPNNSAINPEGDLPARRFKCCGVVAPDCCGVTSEKQQ